MKFRKDRLITVAILTMLVFGFSLVVINPIPATYAFNPQNCVISSGAGQQTTTFAWTAGNPTALLNQVKLGSTCGIAGNQLTIALIYYTPAGVAQSITVTDNESNTWTAVGTGQSVVCSATTGIGGTTCTSLLTNQMDIFSTVLSVNTNFLAVTIHSTPGNFAYNTAGSAPYLVTLGLSTTVFNSCSGSITSRLNGTMISGAQGEPCTVLVPPGSYLLAGEVFSYGGTAGLTHVGTTVPVSTTNDVSFTVANCPFAVPTSSECGTQLGYYANLGSTVQTLQVGYQCTSNCGTGSNGMSFGVAAVVLSPSGLGGSTTTINTMCLGGCTGGQNGTGNYLIRNLLYFYQSQNVAQSATIDNVTLKVGAVHMNVTQGYLYITIYTATGVPSGGNPFEEIPGPTGQLAVPIFNGTSNFFVHWNPQAILPANGYYAVGILAAPEGHSRGSGAANSGVQVMETSLFLREYNYAPAGPSGSAQTPPFAFFSSTPQTPRHFIYVHEIFPVFLLTSTSTSTITVGGTATTTVSTTVTNVVNQLNMSSPGFWFLPLLFLMAPVGFMIAVKRFAGG